MIRKLVLAVALIATGAGALSAAPIRPAEAIPQQQNAVASPASQQVPAAARPKPKQKNSFFGLPLLALLAAGGAAGTAAAVAGGGSDTASPQ